jgi:hypothetical protein
MKDALSMNSVQKFSFLLNFFLLFPLPGLLDMMMSLGKHLAARSLAVRAICMCYIQLLSYGH